MKDITLALDDEILAAGRAYADRRGTTLDALIRELLVKTIVQDREAGTAEMFRLMDASPGNSRGEHWTRDELYSRP